MIGFAKKSLEFFSDIWLDMELFFGSFQHGKKTINPNENGGISETQKKISSEDIPFKLRFVRFNDKERLFFYDQMDTLINSGVTLIDSLLIVQSQTQKKSIKNLYGEMIHRINSGMTLADTMYLFPKVFPHMQSALIEAGEKSGNLKNVLTQIREELETGLDFSKKIKGAMFYPAILIIMAFTMVSGMMIFVIPKVSELYKQSNAQLPVLTQKVIDLSAFVSAKYPVILASIAAIVLFTWLIVSKTRIGKIIWENLVWQMPVLGKISKQKNLMMISSNLGMLLESGVLISDAFEITEKTIDNVHYKKALSEIRHGIILGQNVSEIMGLEDLKTQKFKKNKLFPLQMAQMVHIGELTGTISKMLMKVRSNYRKSIDYTLKNISAMIEPIMIFFVAIIVGSVLLAVMLPFFYIGSTIR